MKLKSIFNSNNLSGFFYCLVMSSVIGWSVSVFLFTLDFVTDSRNIYFPFPLIFLPIGGVFIYFIYKKWGKGSEKGNSIIINEIESNEVKVPTTITPLVFIGTIVTHLFGGSAGREGTAVQMASGICTFFSERFKITYDTRKLLMRSSVSAGFGAVFGTPFAGAIFAIEFLKNKKWSNKYFIFCILSSFIAHFTVLYTGLKHTEYSINSLKENFIFNISIDEDFLFGSILVGVSAGIISLFYKEVSAFVKLRLEKIKKNTWLLPFLGGIIIAACAYYFEWQDYLGLGVESKNLNGISIVNAFKSEYIPYSAFLIKLLLTILTLSVGFKGGEVTPLFFIGACLGNSIALMNGLPLDLCAGLGFISLFGASTKTPITSTVLGIELFGWNGLLYFGLSCFLANLFSGRNSIYYQKKSLS